MQSRMSIAAKLSLGAVLAVSAAAQSLSGHVQSPTGTPLQGVQVSLSNGGGGGSTDASGNFTVTGLQNRTYATVDFASPSGSFAAVERVNVRVSNATSLGTIVMQPGTTVSGTVLAPPGFTAVGGNMNVYDHLGVKQFTPNDAIAPGGTFSIVVPLGWNRVRAVPPVGSGLMPFDWTLPAVTGPVNVGTATLQRGYPFSATVVDAVSGVPVAGIKFTATNALTGEVYPQLADVTTVFGSVTLNLPSLVVVDLELVPPSTDAHMPTMIYGVITVPGPSNYGLVAIERAVFVSGSVFGPSGPVASADMDFYDADNHKLFTPKDNTDATGAFSVRIPVGTYRITAQPPVATGLTCPQLTGVVITAGTNVGVLNAQPGALVSGHLLGPNGAEANGEIRAFDPVTGAQLVLAGNHTDPGGNFGFVIPTGTWRIDARAAQGSLAAPLTVDPFAVTGPTAHDFTLPAKDLVLNVTTFATLTVAQGGFLPINLSVANVTQGTLAMLLDVVVQYPSGAETPVFPTLSIELPPVALSFGPVFMPMPPIPANQLDEPIRYLIRCRSPSTGLLLDEAYATFVAH